MITHYGHYILIWLHFCLLVNGKARKERDVSAEKKSGSFLVQKANIEEYSRLNELLGLPIGNAKTAHATNGTQKTTKFVPKCPEKIVDVPVKMKDVYLERCKSLRKTEYEKHEKEVANIIVKANSGKSPKSYEEQKKDLISAVNKLANAAGPLPSL